MERDATRQETTELYLIRHGESVANVEPIIGGMRGDVGLTELGRRQAALLEERLARSQLEIDMLYSSTLPRARQTAEYVARALRLPINYDDNFQELRPGEADGLSIAEWEQRYGRLEWGFGNPFRPFSPGGESWSLFLVRVGAALQRLVTRHPGQRVAVVCHGGVLEASFFHAFGLGPMASRMVRFGPLNTSITQWRYHPVGPLGVPFWTLITFNDAAHLLGEPADASRQAVPTPVSDK
jgi:probable phosphoglycerate mutase